MSAGTAYYWRITEKNVFGKTAGSVWQFTTMTAPGKTSNPNPADGTVDASITADLSWSGGVNATNYDVYFGNTNPPEFKTNTTNQNYQLLTLSYSTVYYWRIDAINAVGKATGDVWSFTTAAPRPAGKASNPSPANGSASIGLSISLTWTVGTDTESQDVYFGSSNPPAFKINTTSTSYNPGALTLSTKYYWRIDGKNTVGTTAGDLWSFMTTNNIQPTKATNILPLNGTTNYGLNMNLIWSAGQNAMSHDVYIGTANPPAFKANVTTTKYNPGPLTAGAVYYWRIDEVNGAGTAVGDIWQFTTRPASSSYTAPVADFFAIPLSGWDIYYQPEFISLSTGYITNYIWDYGDGTYSTALAPRHQYAQPGTYTITLSVSGPGGESIWTKTDYIVVKDFETQYTWPDHIVAEPTQEAFDAALNAVEESQTPGLAAGDPVWCGTGSYDPNNTNWCTLMRHGGGGRILFGFADATIYANWDRSVNLLNYGGTSDRKRDFFGDNLIIDGQNTNVKFYYNGPGDCGQAENRGCMRIHGNDNIIRNITWDRFPDGIHMRGGQRNLLENLTVNVICEDATTFNGSSNSCIDCTLRNATYGRSTDKTLMYSTTNQAKLVVDNMISTDGVQPIRMTGVGDSVVAIRNSTFQGARSQGPRFGGENGTLIFENNHSTGTQNGVRIGEGISVLLRNNIMENCAAYGIFTYSTGGTVRMEGNIIRNNSSGGCLVESGIDVDAGGGSVDIYANNMLTSPGTNTVTSYGRNTLTGNSSSDMRNNDSTVVKAENCFWDHMTVADVIANDISGSIDVDPLGTP